MVPAIFSLCSLSYQSTLLQTLPHSYPFSHLSGPGTPVSGAAPRFKCWEPALKHSSPSPYPPAAAAAVMTCSTSYLPKWLSYYNFQVLTPTQNIPFCSQAPQWGWQLWSVPQQSSATHWIVPLCCSSTCWPVSTILSDQHFPPFHKKYFKFTSLFEPFLFIGKLCHQVRTSF